MNSTVSFSLTMVFLPSCKFYKKGIQIGRFPNSFEEGRKRLVLYPGIVFVAFIIIYGHQCMHIYLHL